ncbi:lactoylglutathione lyase [Phycisphaerales bacterium]|nr:lactoylglutathione lyase [Phycisphaerales bacterium]
MVNGVHAMLYSRDADATRAFFRDILGWRGVDAGEGWVICAMPPSELASHPTEDRTSTEIYLMCDDIGRTLKELEGKGVKVVRPVADRGWGLAAGIEVPGFGEMGLYEPRHPTAIG